MQRIAFQHNMGWKGKDKEKSIYILHQNEISDDCQWSKSWLQQNFMSPPEKEVSGKTQLADLVFKVQIHTICIYHFHTETKDK